MFLYAVVLKIYFWYIYLTNIYFLDQFDSFYALLLVIDKTVWHSFNIGGPRSHVYYTHSSRLNHC